MTSFDWIGLDRVELDWIGSATQTGFGVRLDAVGIASLSALCYVCICCPLVIGAVRAPILQSSWDPSRHHAAVVIV